MDILRVLNNKKNSLNQIQYNRRNRENSKLIECPGCLGTFSSQVLKDKLRICPDCGYYFPMSPKERVKLIGDEGTIKVRNEGLKSKDPLEFPGYMDKLELLIEKTKQQDAALTGTMKINGITTAFGVMDSRFFMGSMGTVVGEQITQITEYASRKKLPLVIFCLSGGARMQEGIFSLMQMAKTSAAIEKFKSQGGLYISVLCHPTTGGVSASFAFLGDIIIAEPDALIGFAGPRVIEQTIKESLPEGFQRAESQLENGMIDMIADRRKLKETLSTILRIHRYQ